MWVLGLKCLHPEADLPLEFSTTLSAHRDRIWQAGDLNEPSSGLNPHSPSSVLLPCTGGVVLGAYPAIWKAVLSFHLAVAFCTQSEYFPYLGILERARLTVGAELEHALFGFPQKQTPEAVSWVQAVLLKVHGTLDRKWRNNTGEGKQPIKGTLTTQFPQWATGSLIHQENFLAERCKSMP